MLVNINIEDEANFVGTLVHFKGQARKNVRQIFSFDPLIMPEMF